MKKYIALLCAALFFSGCASDDVVTTRNVNVYHRYHNHDFYRHGGFGHDRIIIHGGGHHGGGHHGGMGHGGGHHGGGHHGGGNHRGNR